MTIDVPLPKLLKPIKSGNHTIGFETDKIIHPLKLSVNLKYTPLSYANMDLAQGDVLPTRSFVELYTSNGSVGVYRVRAPQITYGSEIATSELEHAISELGDWLIQDEYDEMTPATTAISTIFSHYGGELWQLGTYSAIGSADVALKQEYTDVLSALLDIMEAKPECMMSFDFSTFPWTLSIVAHDVNVSAECRLGRNVETAKVTYDDTDLCTKCWYETPAEDEDDRTWTSVDAPIAQVNKYGVIEKTISIDSDMDSDVAQFIAYEYVRLHMEPRISIEINALDLYPLTGESLDRFEIGKMCRLALPEYPDPENPSDYTRYEKPITGISWQDVYGQPNVITLTIGDDEEPVFEYTSGDDDE